MKNKTYFVYIYFFPNGKKYIGQTYHGSNRFGTLSHYRGQYVYNALKKYPLYRKEILKDNLEAEEVDYWEKYFIGLYKTNDRKFGYNREDGGHKNKTASEETLLLHQSSEWKANISSSKKGHQVSLETRSKISKSLKGKTTWNKGGHLTEEWKNKLSNNRKDRVAVILDGEKRFNSVTECAKYLKVNKTSVSAVINGRRNKVYGHIIKKEANVNEH